MSLSRGIPSGSGPLATAGINGFDFRGVLNSNQRSIISNRNERERDNHESRADGQPIPHMVEKNCLPNMISGNLPTNIVFPTIYLRHCGLRFI